MPLRLRLHYMRRFIGTPVHPAVAQMCLQYLAENDIREDADGNPPDDPPEAWTILWAIRDAHRDLIGQPGYREMGPSVKQGCGCRFLLNWLFAAGWLKKGKYLRSEPDPEPGLGIPMGNGGPRDITCYWLAKGVDVRLFRCAGPEKAFALHKWWLLRRWVRRRAIALFWQEETQRRLCAPDGEGRASDLEAFCEEFASVQ